jgi:hypothetical protein
MHGIKDDREESDGEEMEHESGESDKSSSSCDSSDAPSDSDDSSGRELLYMLHENKKILGIICGINN